MGEPTAPGKAKLKFTGLRDFALQHFCVVYRPIHLSQSQSAFYITATCTISADKIAESPSFRLARRWHPIRRRADYGPDPRRVALAADASTAAMLSASWEA